MVALNNLDFTGVGLLKDGTYDGFITKADAVVSANNNQYLQLRVEVEGREITDRLNLWNTSATVASRAKATLTQIAKALGLPDVPADSDMLLDKRLKVTVATETGTSDGKGGTWDDKNVIKKYSAAAASSLPAEKAVPLSPPDLAVAPPTSSDENKPVWR